MRHGRTNTRQTRSLSSAELEATRGGMQTVTHPSQVEHPIKDVTTTTAPERSKPPGDEFERSAHR